LPNAPRFYVLAYIDGFMFLAFAVVAALLLMLTLRDPPEAPAIQGVQLRSGHVGWKAQGMSRMGAEKAGLHPGDYKRCREEMERLGFALKHTKTGNDYAGLHIRIRRTRRHRAPCRAALTRSPFSGQCQCDGYRVRRMASR
jgi:hypothetical protein